METEDCPCHYERSEVICGLLALSRHSERMRSDPRTGICYLFAPNVIPSETKESVTYLPIGYRLLQAAPSQ